MAIEGAANLICALVEAFDALARSAAHFPYQFRAAAVGFVLERRHGFARLEEGQGAGDGRLRPVHITTNRRLSTTDDEFAKDVLRVKLEVHWYEPVQE